MVLLLLVVELLRVGLLEGAVHGSCCVEALAGCHVAYEYQAVGHLWTLLVLSLQVCYAEHAVRRHLLDLAQRS